MNPIPSTVPAFLWHAIRRPSILVWFVFLVTVNIITVVASLGLSAAVGQIVNIATSPDPTHDYSPVFTLIVVLMLLIILSRFGHGIGWLKGRVPMEMGAKRFLYENALRHGPIFFNNNPTGKVAQKIHDLAWAIVILYEESLLTVLPGLIVTLAATAALFLLHPLLGFIMLGWSCLFLMMSTWFALRQGRLSVRRADAKGMTAGALVDSLSNVASIHMFSHEMHERTHIGSYIAEEEKATRHLLYHGAMLKLVRDTPIFVLTCLLFWAGLDLHARGEIQSDVLAVMVTIIMVLMTYLSNFVYGVESIVEQTGTIREGLSFLSRPYELSDATQAQSLAVPRGAIHFRNLTYRHQGRNILFENLDLSIAPGERIGLVGPSGAGKSTLINLLMRFFDAPGQEILIDGQNIGTVTRHSLRRHIATIPQETSLFHRTLMENIRYGRLDATDEEVIEAAKKAYAHDFIAALPEGYGTYVGERGVKLSGGQRQRIGIARAILKNAPILILDEATSALDSESEKLIQDSLLSLMAGRTVIAIAHRLSTIAHLDRLIVLDHGRIVEDGTHNDLLKRNGLYARLWRMQSGGFLTEDPAPVTA